MKKKIFILHGWAYSTDKWKPFMELLQRKKIEVTLLKVPGLTAPLDEVWDLDDYVAWLQDILRKEKEPVVLLGHSNGGRISLAYTLLYPDKVEKLVLIDSAGIYHNEFSLQMKRFIFGNLAKLKKFVKGAIFKRLLYILVRESDYNNANTVMKRTMQHLIESDLTEQLSMISIQTIIIWGENDKVTPVADGKLMHEKIKRSKLFIIKDARHSPQFTHTQEVADIVYANL